MFIRDYAGFMSDVCGVFRTCSTTSRHTEHCGRPTPVVSGSVTSSTPSSPWTRQESFTATSRTKTSSSTSTLTGCISSTSAQAASRSVPPTPTTTVSELTSLVALLLCELQKSQILISSYWVIHLRTTGCHAILLAARHERAHPALTLNQ